MKILFCGDVVGRSGRDVVLRHIPTLRIQHRLDMVIVNAENMANGFGLTGKLCDELFRGGVDIITSGNHMWDEESIIPYIAQHKNLIRPINFPPGTPGNGSVLWSSPKGHKVLVVNVMGRLFMDPLDCPFQTVESALKTYELGSSVDAIIVDVHAETTSEKMALGYVLDGRASLVVGTHTHIPTADHRILPKGTGYQTDAGMCGDYDSILGMERTVPIFKFQNKRKHSERMKAANGPGTLCGIILETHTNGLAKTMTPVRMGPHLESTV